MRLSAIHDFLFELLRRKHEKMLAKHTDKRKACPYDAYRISIFFAAVGFFLPYFARAGMETRPYGVVQIFVSANSRNYSM